MNPAPGAGLISGVPPGTAKGGKHAPDLPAGRQLLIRQFQTQVIPYDPALQVTIGHGKGHFILAGIRERGGEAQGARGTQALVGIVADGVGVPQRGVLRAVAPADGRPNFGARA